MQFVGWRNFKNFVTEGAFEDQFGNSHNYPHTNNTLKQRKNLTIHSNEILTRLVWRKLFGANTKTLLKLSSKLSPRLTGNMKKVIAKHNYLLVKTLFQRNWDYYLQKNKLNLRCSSFSTWASYTLDFFDCPGSSWDSILFNWQIWSSSLQRLNQFWRRGLISAGNSR